MTASAEKSRIAGEKKALVRELLSKGKSATHAHNAVKRKFGSGIASRDVIDIRKQIDAYSVSKPHAPAPTSPARGEKRDGTLNWINRVPNPVVSPPKAKESAMRRFVLDRSFDATGTSGVGIVAEGVQFSSGHVVIHWLSQLEAINVYGNAMVLEQLHGHNGNTVITWLDP